MSYTGPGQFERVTRGFTTFATGALGLGREQTGTATTDFTRDDDGLLLALRTGPSATNTYYPLFDGIGSLVALTDSNGDLAASYKYEPFGKQTCLSGCSIANPYQWLGGLGVYLDSATGLYKMGTRYYDPALGRFTQVDPVAGGSANRYDYASQDPVNLADPDGLFWSERLVNKSKRAASSVARTGAKFGRFVGRNSKAGYGKAKAAYFWGSDKYRTHAPGAALKVVRVAGGVNCFVDSYQYVRASFRQSPGGPSLRKGEPWGHAGQAGVSCATWLLTPP